MIPVSVAPMMDRTDRHFRWMMRRVTRRTLLYTEMVTAAAIVHGDPEHLLGHDDEGPVALQLGGDDPASLAYAAKVGVDFGYAEINLNVGCPSDRVQKGRFGACLMAHPEVVADAVAAMRAAVDVEVTVKHRIGIDDLDSYEHMRHFVDVVAQAGCRRFTVHARKAWLSGLSPKENRNVPPLRYDEVWRLKQERPDLDIEINGGIRTVEATLEHLEHVDGVMIGRAAVDDPMLFARLERAVFDQAPPSETAADVVRACLPYAALLEERGEPPHRLTRHMIPLFTGQPGARIWRRRLTEGFREPATVVLPAALDAVLDAQARAA